MSKTLVKMLGLVLMVLSVFAVLFGIHLPAALGTGGAIWTALVVVGIFGFIAGFVLYVVVRKD